MKNLKLISAAVFSMCLLFCSCSSEDESGDFSDMKLDGEWEITARTITSYNKDWDQDAKDNFTKWDKAINGLYREHGEENELKYTFNDQQKVIGSTTTRKKDGVLLKDLKESYTLIGQDSIVVMSQGLGEITRQGKYRFTSENACLALYYVNATTIRPFLEEIGVDPQIPNGAQPFYATIAYRIRKK